ncbi:Hsp20/alpha crystallin family protein [Nocardia jiangsuensis]|uniref:Hsp20/alpha crystallin family protein n=1 Tax=Nocardia jiangsuensis TaxID=1691563 RepID=A0ABV8DQ82_9NOCA
MNTIATQHRAHTQLPSLVEWLSNLPALGTVRPLFDNHLIKVEVTRDDTGVVVRAELPGVDPDKDVSVTVRDGVLHIRAERSESTESQGRSEFSYGSFLRALALPAGAREDDITAAYDKGILTVTVPVSAETPPAEKTIAISSAE